MCNLYPAEVSMNEIVTIDEHKVDVNRAVKVDMYSVYRTDPVELHSVHTVRSYHSHTEY